MRRTLLFVLALAGMFGCAASPHSDPARCYDCVSFRIMDSDLRPTRDVVGPSRIEICGDPISPEEVTVLELQAGEETDKSVANKLGKTARYVDWWFGVELQPNYVRKAQQTIARRGCNLLILSETRTHWHGSDGKYVSGTSEYRLIRWGIY
jgi:hypothetical protein